MRYLPPQITGHLLSINVQTAATPSNFLSNRWDTGTRVVPVRNTARRLNSHQKSARTNANPKAVAVLYFKRSRQ